MLFSDSLHPHFEKCTIISSGVKEERKLGVEREAQRMTKQTPSFSAALLGCLNALFQKPWSAGSFIRSNPVHAIESHLCICVFECVCVHNYVLKHTMGIKTKRGPFIFPFKGRFKE